ncbi:hypothetical protein ACQKIC_20210 [Peribacillus sp. NPDC046944]|uniref:hypothetical protein n=1 Tax=unclassified Peribacillus TaxID=2675266 RepID=UPI003D013BB5
MAIAGQAYTPNKRRMRRMLGMYLHYADYLRRISFKSKKPHFSVPSNFKYDPTEKGHFSNLAGKSLGDFLAKKLSGAVLTFNYEASMKKRGTPIVGSRPDLLCIRRDSSYFALEAKGYTESQ